MDTALGEFVALGVTTNIAFLRNALNHPSFVEGRVDTDFLDNSSTSDFQGKEPDEAVLVVVAAAAKRLGLGVASSVSADSEDEHTGHRGDPFRTLRRAFP